MSRCSQTGRVTGANRPTTAIAAVPSTSDADKLGIEMPACAEGEGDRGRGLFATGDSPDVPMVKTPLAVTVCVPEQVGPGASQECVDAVRSLYEKWNDRLGVSPPESIVDFLVQGEMPKDLRVAVALVWCTKVVPAWRAYRTETVPEAFDSLYLASEDELEALQDKTIQRMAIGSAANYAAGWEQLKGNYPEVVTALKEAYSNAVDELVDDFTWARACAHTRAMSGKLGNGQCAFVVPGVDLANHSFTPNTKFEVAADEESFQLVWDMEWSTTAGKRAEPSPPKPNDEVLICYGERMPNALLMLHYGFLDPSNPKDQLPMDVMIPDARKINSGTVAKAGKALSDSNDEKAEWAARQMMQMADPSGSGDAQSDIDAIDAMRSASNTLLSSFPTSVKEDQRLLDSGDTITARMEMIVRYRLLQKQNILAFMRFLDTAEAEMGKA